MSRSTRNPKRNGNYRLRINTNYRIGRFSQKKCQWYYFVLRPFLFQCAFIKFCQKTVYFARITLNLTNALFENVDFLGRMMLIEVSRDIIIIICGLGMVLARKISFVWARIGLYYDVHLIHNFNLSWQIYYVIRDLEKCMS